MVDILETEDDYVCTACGSAYGVKSNAEKCCSEKPNKVGHNTFGGDD